MTPAQREAIEDTTETGAAFAERLSITMETVIAAPEVSEDGRQRTQWWECVFTVGDRRETFRYGMGDGHRTELRGGQRGGQRQRYTGKMPATYHPDGSAHLWPKGTRIADADRYERSRPTTPKLGEVLECFTMDAQCASGHTDFGEWAEEYGYEEPGEAWDAWQSLQSTARKLRKLFGSEFRNLLNVREEC